MNDLRKENETLKAKLLEKPSSFYSEIDDLVDINSLIDVKGTYKSDKYGRQGKESEWQVSVSWSDIFSGLSPYLLNELFDYQLRYRVSSLFNIF
jgi:hypothetical protein